MKNLTNKTLQSLISGSHPLSKKYGGKQVFVIDQEVIPLKRGKSGLLDFKKLKQKYGQSPVLTFVPLPNSTYIL